MNASVLCLVSVLAAPPAGPALPTVYSPSPQFERVIRAQSPDVFYQSPPMYAQGPTFAPPGQLGAPIENPPAFVAPDSGGIPVGPPVESPYPNYAPVLPPSQPFGSYSGDPFLGGSSVVPLSEIAEPAGTLPVSLSIDGLHPYRFGITHRLDFGLIPNQDTERNANLGQLGSMGIFAFDYEAEYTWPVLDRSIFSATFQYGQRSWDGPSNAGPPGTVFTNAIDLPGSVHRFGGDFELTTSLDCPVIFQAGFNPSINSDFEQDLTHKAWNFDGRAVVFNRVSPRTTLVGGVIYWDRVDNIVLPYIGVIRKPTPTREYELVFPYPRLSFLIGNGGGIAKWWYVRGEYHVEAYEVTREPLTGGGGPYQDQIQLRDWRVLSGIRTINPYGVSAFVEAGAIFSREVEFLRATPGYDINSGFIARAGLHF